MRPCGCLAGNPACCDAVSVREILHVILHSKRSVSTTFFQKVHFDYSLDKGPDFALTDSQWLNLVPECGITQAESKRDDETEIQARVALLD
jgi:hypothetical protein